MTDHDIHGCGRAGAFNGVLCAVAGALVAGLMVWALEIGGLIGFPRVPIQLAGGLIALFVGAGQFGKKAGVFLCKRRNDLSTNILIGIALAFGSMAIGVWAGTIVLCLREQLSGHVPNIGALILAMALGWLFPFVYFLIFGGIPAALLGVWYGFLMRQQLRSLRS